LFGKVSPQSGQAGGKNVLTSESKSFLMTEDPPGRLSTD